MQVKCDHVLTRCRMLAENGQHGRFLHRNGGIPLQPDEIMTLKEVARLLNVAEKTVYSMSQRKELPAFEVRGQWRFRREDIDRWIGQQQDDDSAVGANE